MNRRGFFKTITGLAGGMYAAFTGKAKKDYYNQPVDAGAVSYTHLTLPTTPYV